MSQKLPNIISSDVEIKGTVTFGNDLIADGKIEGEILSSGTLIVGHNGRVDGDIAAGNVMIHGRVSGNVTAEEIVELRDDCELHGDLSSPRVIIDDGATFVGRANINPITKAAPAAAPTPTAQTKKQA